MVVWPGANLSLLPNADLWNRLRTNKKVCLEVYIIQKIVFTILIKWLCFIVNVTLLMLVLAHFVSDSLLKFALCLCVSTWVLSSFRAWWRDAFLLLFGEEFLTEDFHLSTVHDEDTSYCSNLHVCNFESNWYIKL